MRNVYSVRRVKLVTKSLKSVGRVNDTDILIKKNSRLLYCKRNGKRRSCATIELWMHLIVLLSSQEARVTLGHA